ncbi:MAG: ABC transporter permease [Actinomycetota bacterium]
MIEAYKNSPAWLRWPLLAALGILVLSIVQSAGDTTLLTSSGSSSAMLKWSMPILLAGLGGLVSDRAGIVNIGLEGMMILGTWAGAWGAFNWGPWAGLLTGLIAGGLGGLLHAIATVQFSVDQIVSGVAINILGPGLTRYLSERIFVNYDGGSQTQSPRVDGIGEFTMPFLAGGNLGGWKSPDLLGWIEDRSWFWLSDMAGMLRGLMFQLRWFTVLGLLLAVLVSWVLWRTTLGLRLRSSGENPNAGESLGVDIYRQRYIAVIISGAFAGLAGAYIVLELTGIYRGGQTQGRGFIALAAVIFGNWRASGVLFGALLFSYPLGLSFSDFDGSATRSLLLVVAIALAAVTVWAFRNGRRVDAGLAFTVGAIALLWYLLTDAAPDWLPNTMPYALVLLVLVFASQNLQMPRSLGEIYRRGET